MSLSKALNVCYFWYAVWQSIYLYCPRHLLKFIRVSFWISKSNDNIRWRWYYKQWVKVWRRFSVFSTHNNYFSISFRLWLFNRENWVTIWIFTLFRIAWVIHQRQPKIQLTVYHYHETNASQCFMLLQSLGNRQ